MLALTELAQRGTTNPVPILEIAEARAIPLHFLEQLFAGLRRAGVLQSQRGVKGGYSFRRPPTQVTVLDVVEIVDGQLAANDERPTGEDIWEEARAALCQVLAGVTVADIVEREARASTAPMFFI